MRIYADEGNIDARLAASLSHEKIYTLNVIVCDFVGDPDLIFVLVAAWLRENQPYISTLDDGRKKGYRFQMDLNDGDSSTSACSSPSAPSSKRKAALCMSAMPLSRHSQSSSRARKSSILTANW